MALLDALAFSSVWVSGAAALLTAAAAKAMAVPAPPEALVIAFAGTFFVYNVDRLRDVARDRETSPERTAFVTTHRARLRALSAGAALLAVAAGLRAGAEVAGLADRVVDQLVDGHHLVEVARLDRAGRPVDLGHQGRPGEVFG